VLNHIAPEFAVESKFVSGDNIVEEYRSFVDQGYEGAVVKETGKDTEYKFNKRSSDWRKMIPEHEHIDLRITAVQEGEDSMSGSVGSITVETSDGYELGNVTESLPGTSGTDWDNRRTIIGEIVEVSWRELQVNDDGTEYSLRFPSLEGYRDDKTSADSLSRVQSLM
jgi:ATP-dependent DNA ligase